MSLFKRFTETESEPVTLQRPESGGSLVPIDKGADSAPKSAPKRKTQLELMTEECARLQLINAGQRVMIHDLMIAILDGRRATAWEDTPIAIDQTMYYRALEKAIGNKNDSELTDEQLDELEAIANDN